MTSWIIFYFWDPATEKASHFPSLGAAIIAAKLAHAKADGEYSIHIFKSRSVDLTQKTLIDILNGEKWEQNSRYLAYTVAGATEIKWYPEAQWPRSPMQSLN